MSKLQIYLKWQKNMVRYNNGNPSFDTYTTTKKNTTLIFFFNAKIFRTFFIIFFSLHRFYTPLRIIL